MTDLTKAEALVLASARWGSVVVCAPLERRKDRFTIWRHDPSPEGGDLLIGIGKSWQEALDDAEAHHGQSCPGWGQCDACASLSEALGGPMTLDFRAAVLREVEAKLREEANECLPNGRVKQGVLYAADFVRGLGGDQ